MKIALLSCTAFDSSVGGVENHIRFLGRALQEQGHELVLFKPVFFGPWCTDSVVSDRLVIQYVNLGHSSERLARTVNSYRGWMFLGKFMGRLALNFGYKQVVKAILSWEPDLVWQHDLSANWLAARVMSRHVPVVLTNHLGEYLFLRRSMLTRHFLPRVLNHYAAIIGPSRELTPSLPRAVTIPNGVDTESFKPVGQEERVCLRRRLFGRDADRFVVFCPRRWAPTKGVVYLARAVRELQFRASSNDKLFVFAGDGCPDYPKYRAMVEEVLEDCEPTRVIRLGNVDVYDMVQYYQAADLTVIPSLMEATSLAVLESMACGTPVLATNVGGIREIIRHGETGFLVEPGDPGALASSIQEIASGCHDVTGVRERALRMVRDTYDWRAIALRTEEVLLQAATGDYLAQ